MYCPATCIVQQNDSYIIRISHAPTGMTLTQVSNYKDFSILGYQVNMSRTIYLQRFCIKTTYNTYTCSQEKAVFV